MVQRAQQRCFFSFLYYAHAFRNQTPRPMKRLLLIACIAALFAGCRADDVVGPDIPSRPQKSTTCDHNVEDDCPPPPPPPDGGGGHNTEGGKVYTHGR